MKKTPIKTDEQLIESALKGHKADLELLIRRHQDWIFNIALTFTGDHNEAADLSQEVLIKMITKLSSFQSKQRVPDLALSHCKKSFSQFATQTKGTEFPHV